MSDPVQTAALEAAHAREHARRCALETFYQRLAGLVGQELLDRAWAAMEANHGPQPRPAEEASE